MTDGQEIDPDRPKRIANLASELSDYCGRRQGYYAAKSQDFGFSREMFNDIASRIEGVPDDPILANTESALLRFRAFVEAKEKELEKTVFGDISSWVYTLGTAVAASGDMLDPGFVYSRIEIPRRPEPPPLWTKDRVEKYAERVEKIDAELGKIMRSVWQTFYGGTENAERSAMGLMRQLYDHFFSALAPEEQVRQSAFFAEKEGDDPKRVDRREKILYAANVHVVNLELRELLETQSSYVIEQYGRLNKLHKRGPLNREETRTLLISMQALLEQWIDALGL